jgi:hypothetical protein
MTTDIFKKKKRVPKMPDSDILRSVPDEDRDDNATDDALHLGHPVWHAPGELARDSGSMLLGTSLP